MTNPDLSYQGELADLMAFADGDGPSAAAPTASASSLSTPQPQDWPEDDAAADDAEPQDDEGGELYFGSVDEFVREVIVPIYRRKVGPRGTRRWSAEWWRSAEAISRLDALWRSWEHLRLDGATGLSSWWRDHADYHMSVLFDPDGPFGASEDENKADQPLPYVPPPPGLFTDARSN